MRLADLKPRWLEPDKLFVFLCPHCQKTWLSCTIGSMPRKEQCEVFARELTSDFDRANVVPCNPSAAWTMANGPNFETMSITPSLDASASGHWHGHIKNDEAT